MQVIIDRFEGDFAVVELDKNVFIDVDRRILPKCSEGDVIDILVNKDETSKRKAKIKSLTDKLFED